MKLKIGDLRGYDSEAENVPAEEIKIDFWGVFRAETPLISPIKSMLQDPKYCIFTGFHWDSIYRSLLTLYR